MTRQKVAGGRTQLAVNGLLVAVYAAVPFATLAAGNRSEVAPGELVVPYLIVTVPALVALVIVVLWRGPAAAGRVGPPLALALLFTFDYHELRGFYAELGDQLTVAMITFWALTLILLVAATAKLAARSALLAPALLAAGVVMLAPSVARYTDYSLSVRAAATGNYRPARRLTLAQHPAPDVFFFMLDAYGRPDRLREQLHYSDRPFVQFLQSKGFVIPTRSRPAYAFTALSVPAMLQMDYVATGPQPANLSQARDAIGGRNRTVSALRSLGYGFAYAPSEYADWNCTGAEDICIRPSSVSAGRLGVSEFQWAMLERTPLGDALKKVLPSTASDALANRRQFPEKVVKSVFARHSSRPLFTFAHTLLAHPLYLYHGRACRYRYTVTNNGVAGLTAYLEALRCLNTQVESAVKAVLAHDPDAVIVLASDHGSDVDVNHGIPEWRWPPDLQRRRFANFVALRLPRRCRGSVPDQLIEVNIMRIVLNCLSDARLPMLPARQFLVDQPTGDIRPAHRNLSP